jgi:hypothetical protein
MRLKAVLVAVLVLAGLSAAAQTSGSIEVLDIMAPGERRKVQPNWTAINAQPLGSAGNPVRAFMPDGEYAYLRDLLCADGLRPFYKRVSNVGAGPYTTIVDVFDVRCGTASYRVYMDMYHPGYAEKRAVSGFTLRPLSKAEQFLLKQ